MTQTKVIGESVKQTNKTFIKHYTEGYCDALTENLKLYTIDMYNRPTFGGELRSTPSQYQLDRLAEIENGTAKLDISEQSKVRSISKLFHVSGMKRDKSIEIAQLLLSSIKILVTCIKQHHGNHLLSM